MKSGESGRKNKKSTTERKKKRQLPIKGERMIAIKILYDGKNYMGMQPHLGIDTVGGRIETSIRKSGLGRSSPVYCGRTDGGVSGKNMVANLIVGSRFEVPNCGYFLTKEDRMDYPYDVIFNERLPKDIHISGWAPVPMEFSSRHTCIERKYRYYFMKGGLNLRRMEEAIEKIKEMDDFYKLSTHSNKNARYKRKINTIDLVLVKKGRDIENSRPRIEREISKYKNRHRRGSISLNTETAWSDDIYYLEISARSFLHNMVRKIMWLVKSYGYGFEFELEGVGIDDPEPLVFVDCIFPTPLNFIENKFTRPLLETASTYMAIENEISKMKLDTLKRNN